LECNPEDLAFLEKLKKHSIFSVVLVEGRFVAYIKQPKKETIMLISKALIAALKSYPQKTIREILYIVYKGLGI